MAKIRDIIFFIQCIENLRDLYQNADENRRKQLSTMLKTWMFYNSTEKDIFWTGNSSDSVLNGGDKVKEHHFGNLSSVEYILNPEIGNQDFFELTTVNQLLKIFQFMQWNYTTPAENQRLRNFQNTTRFYDEFEGNPNLIYNEAGIELENVEAETNLLPKLERFFNNMEGNQNSNSKIYEVTLSNNLLNTFCNALEEGVNHFELDIKMVKIGKKGVIYKLTNRSSSANFYKITMFALWKCFRNQEEIKTFLNETNREIGESGPYRRFNNFDKTYGNYAFSLPIVEGNLFDNIIWLWSRYNDTERYRLVSQILEFFEASLCVYDCDLNIKEYN